MANAALEWQVRSLGWRSRVIVAAWPLEGLVRSVASTQETTADIGCIRNTHVTSATASIIALTLPDSRNLLEY